MRGGQWSFILLAGASCASAPSNKRPPSTLICRENIFIGLGLFDACFDPERARLQIDVRVAFHHLASTDPQQEAREERFAMEEASRFWSGTHRLLFATPSGPEPVTAEVRVLRSERPHFNSYLIHAPLRSQVGMATARVGNVLFASRTCTLYLVGTGEEDRRVVRHEFGHMLGLG